MEPEQRGFVNGYYSDEGFDMRRVVKLRESPDVPMYMDRCLVRFGTGTARADLGTSMRTHSRLEQLEWILKRRILNPWVLKGRVMRPKAKEGG